jgi:putative PIN family toxin of toxin-antitoxin system
MRLVLDTNVLIAAFVSRGVCHELLEHCERLHSIVSSEFLLLEFENKLLGKFKVPREKAAAAASLLRSKMEVIEPAALDPPACRDPDDDWVLATARSGDCECIVTGDKDLLVLDPFGRIRILAPGAFWTYEAARSSNL